MMETKGASSSGEMSPSASMKPRYRPRPMPNPARSAWPLPTLVANETRRTTLSGKPVERERAAVGRAVRHRDDLEGHAGCVEHAHHVLDRCAEAVAGVVVRHDDGDVDRGIGEHGSGRSRTPRLGHRHHHLTCGPTGVPRGNLGWRGYPTSCRGRAAPPTARRWDYEPDPLFELPVPPPLLFWEVVAVPRR